MKKLYILKTVMLIFLSFKVSAYGLHEENAHLATRGVLFLRLDANGFKKMKDEKHEIVAYQDKNLTQEFLRIDAEGIFKNKTQLAVFEVSSPGRAPDPWKYVEKMLPNMDKEPFKYSDFIIVERTELSNIVIPFDEVVGDGVYRVRYEGKDYYVKASKGLEFKVIKDNKEVAAKINQKYGKKIDELIDVLLACFIKNDFLCKQEIKKKNKIVLESIFRGTRSDLLLNLNGDLQNLKRFFSNKERLVYQIVSPYKDTSVKTICYYYLEGKDFLDENNYDELRRYFLFPLVDRLGACFAFHEYEGELEDYSFRVISMPSDWGE